MINADTRNLLKQLKTVNNQMILANDTYGCNEFKSILFKANLGLVDDIPEEFGIFDMTNFVSALELLEDPEVTFNPETKVITAKDGNSTLQFLTSTPDSLDNVQINPKLISSTVAADSVFECQITEDHLKQVKKAQGVFKNFDTLWIDNTNGAEMKLGTKNSFSKSNNAFSIKLTDDINTKEFSISLPLESLMVLPDMDYTLRVKYNEERDAYRVVLDNALLTFVLSLQKD